MVPVASRCCGDEVLEAIEAGDIESKFVRMIKKQDGLQVQVVDERIGSNEV